MAKKLYQLDNPNDIEELQKMLYESDEENERHEFENESDIDDEDSVEVCSEDSDSVQDISSEESEVEENEDENYFFGKDKETRWRKKIRSQVRKQPQNILSQKPFVCPKAENAKTEFESWNCFISDNILDVILQYTNKYIDSVSKRFSRDRDAKRTDKTELKAFLGLLYLAGLHRSNRQNLQDLWATDGSGIELFRLTMSLRRFRFLHNSIRFDDKITRPERLKIDKLAAVRHIFLYLWKTANCATLWGKM